jgi:hypothetical protein
MTPLKAMHLRELEFLLRSYIRPDLFPVSIGADRARGIIVDLICRFRESRALLETSSFDLQHALGLSLRKDAFSQQFARLRHDQAPPKIMVDRVPEIVAVLLLGTEGKQLLEPIDAPPRFTPLVLGSGDDPHAAAGRLVRLLFPETRACYASAVAHGKRDAFGFFDFRLPISCNTYEARGDLAALSWCAHSSKKNLTSAVVRVSGALAFPQVRPLTDRDMEESSHEGVVLTRSGQETINLLKNGAPSPEGDANSAVVFVTPEGCPDHTEPRRSYLAFRALAARYLSGEELSRLVELQLPPTPANLAYLHPWLRFVWHYVGRTPQAKSGDLWRAVGLRFQYTSDQKTVDPRGQTPLHIKAFNALPALLVQRQCAERTGPAAWEPLPEEVHHFQAWLRIAVEPRLADVHPQIAPMLSSRRSRHLVPEVAR